MVSDKQQSEIDEVYVQRKRCHKASINVAPSKLFDPRNIEFIERREEYLDTHGGD
ncbi:hypothetical protein GCM10023331_01760 [Algivirga pacifica]|uniref:Uncharacterized protein n=1 Tax=Algivirga pacifica TaxID=1162670 RepID=A0ABP9CWI3_9BACT